MQKMILSVYARFEPFRAAFSDKNILKLFSENRLTSEMERGIILLDKDKHAVFIRLLIIYKIGGRGYGKKIHKNHSLCTDTYAVIARHGSGGKNKAKTCSKDKDFNSRTDIQTKVKRVSGKAKVKWKTGKKSVVSIVKKKRKYCYPQGEEKGNSGGYGSL